MIIPKGTAQPIFQRLEAVNLAKGLKRLKTERVLPTNSPEAPVSERTAPETGEGMALCSVCRKEPVAVGGLCIGCDHLMDDVLLDRQVD